VTETPGGRSPLRYVLFVTAGMMAFFGIIGASATRFEVRIWERFF
jgi:hypothetical protein